MHYIYARPYTPVHLLISRLACPLFFPILSFCLALGAFGLVWVSSWTFLTLRHVLSCRWILLDTYLISGPRHILASPSQIPVMLISLGCTCLSLCASHTACKCHLVVDSWNIPNSVVLIERSSAQVPLLVAFQRPDKVAQPEFDRPFIGSLFSSSYTVKNHALDRWRIR